MMSVLPTPRMANDAALKPLILLAEKFGTMIAMSAKVLGCSSVMSAESTADTAMGVDCRFDSRRVAVTTISSRPPLASEPAVCACAPADSIAPATSAPWKRPMFFNFAITPPQIAAI